MNKMQIAQTDDNIKSVLLMIKDSLVAQYCDAGHIPHGFHVALGAIKEALNTVNRFDLYCCVVDVEAALQDLPSKRYKTYRKMLLEYMTDDTN